MKNIYIIIGEGGCGKSSIVRCLTGTYQTGWRDLALTNGTTITIAIWPRSAQEGTVQTPQDVLTTINQTNMTDFLIVLRPWGAQPYIDLLSSQHNIVQTLLISRNATLPTVNLPNGISVNSITDSRSRPINANAAMIRNWWGWV